MSESASERRLAENEVIFRQKNEHAVQSIKEIQEHELEDDIKATISEDSALHFHCECADDTCQDRIIISPSEYESIHTQTNMFMVIPGHEFPEIEKVTKQEPEYYIVQKYMTPPKKTSKLNSTEENTKNLT